MTLTWQDDLVDDEVQLPAWNPMVSSRAPGFGLALRMADRLRLVVLDLTDRGGTGTDLLREVRGCRALDAGELADRLVRTTGGGARCSGVAIADLFPDRMLDLQVRDAPPAVVLSAGQPTRLLAGGTPERLTPDAVLLLCSASFLEEPPPVMGTVRRRPADHTALVKLRQALRAAPKRGATASVAGRTPVR